MRLLFILLTLAGCWLVASPFVLGYLGVARGNALLIGLVIIILSIMGTAGVVTVRKSGNEK